MNPVKDASEPHFKCDICREPTDFENMHILEVCEDCMHKHSDVVEIKLFPSDIVAASFFLGDKNA